MRKALVAAAAAGLILAALAPAVFAGTTRYPFTATSWLTDIPEIGVEKLVGDTYHVTGMVLVYGQDADNDMVSGTMTVTVNFAIGGPLGQGNAMWGTERLEPTAYPGQYFDCVMSGGWDKDSVMQADDRCIGVGPDLAGWQFRSHISAETTVTGYLYKPGS